MSINIFSGARRVTVVAAVLIVAVAAFDALDSKPYLFNRFLVLDPRGQQPFIPTDSICRAPAEAIEATVRSPAGYSVDVEVCVYPAIVADDPAAVAIARRRISEAFTAEDFAEIDRKGREYMRSVWEELLVVCALSLAALWAASWIVGWVVRGFLGIPRGMDRRPES